MFPMVLSVGYSAYQCIYEESGLTSRYNQLSGTQECLQRSFYEKKLTPKSGGSFILESLTNRSHQVDLVSLHGPCLVLKILSNMKPVDQY